MALSLTITYNYIVIFVRNELMALLDVKIFDRANISELISALILSLAFTNPYFNSCFSTLSDLLMALLQAFIFLNSKYINMQ